MPLGLIDAPNLPAREKMDEDKLDELAASIRTIGLIQPLILARTGVRYEVIAGHRRLLACDRAGLIAVVAVVYPNPSAALEAIKFGENRYREDLNAADEAIWFTELLERDCGGDVDRLCAQLGEKRPYVEGRLNLFRGDVKIFEALQAERISIGIASELNKCPDEQYRRYLLHQAILGGATISVVRAWLLDWKQSTAHLSGEPATPNPMSTPAPIPQTDFFRCYVCGETNDVYLMQPVNIHGYCLRAILDKLLAAYRGELAS